MLYSCNDSKDSDQPTYPPSLTGLFAAHGINVVTVIRLCKCADWSQCSWTHLLEGPFSLRCLCLFICQWIIMGLAPRLYET